MERQSDTAAYKSATKIQLNLNSQLSLPKQPTSPGKKSNLRKSFKPIVKPKIQIKKSKKKIYEVDE